MTPNFFLPPTKNSGDRRDSNSNSSNGHSSNSDDSDFDSSDSCNSDILSKKKLDTLTTDAMFSGQRFAILVMFIAHLQMLHQAQKLGPCHFFH